MLAVILAGGLGTRLRPYTVTIPKPLLPLGEIPILEVVVRQLVAAGFDRIVLTLGHMPHLFKAIFDDGRRFGVKIEYCTEHAPGGTAGAIRLVESLEPNFLVMNGDLLTTINYRDLLDVHEQRGADGTIAVTRREHKVDYGVIRIDDQGLLDGYDEKPTIDYRVSMGINVLSSGCLEHIPARGRFDMPDLMLGMARAGKTVLCHETDCYWQDIGRFDDYEHATADFVSDPAKFVPRMPTQRG
jgi:NDP-sugar pyrophosphorylase family protein